MRRPVIGVMGGGEVSDRQAATAYELGRLIAESGWVVLNGGRNVGVMEASARGAREAGGFTVGILPDDHRAHASEHLDLQIVTGMGSARNNINVLSSDVVVACTGGPGTLSEIALALKAGRPVIVLDAAVAKALSDYVDRGEVMVAEDPAAAVTFARALLSAADPSSGL